MTTRLTAALFLTAAISVAESPINYTATSANVAGAPDSIRINVLRWSTDAERDQVLAAWNLTAPAPAAGRGGGRGAARGAASAAPDPAADDGNAAAPAAGARGGGRGAARGGAAAGRGGGRGGSAPAAALTPEASLAAALQKAPTIGYLWSSEVAGYSLRYAGRFPQADGGERILLITDRRLGAWNEQWKLAGGSPTDAAPTDYDFSVVELRLNSKGEGEGKVSLTGKVALDAAAKAIGLENYSGVPVILKNVRRK